MARETLYRASLEIKATEGRNISGLAVPWDRPTLVRDLPGQGPYPGRKYLEAMAPGSADVTMRQHPSFPIFVRHDIMTDPLGVVAFHRSAEGLLFDGTLSRTRDADDKLALIHDGAMGDVSVGFRPIKATMRRFAQGEGVYRTEIAIRELSLAPTGYGQYAEARVLAVRMDGDEDPGALMQGVDAAIDAAVKCLTPSDDDYNPAQALALLQAAESTVDSLLALCGLVDADDEATDAGDAPVIEMPRMGHDDLRRRARHAADSLRRISLGV